MKVHSRLLFSRFILISSKKHIKSDWVSAAVILSHLAVAAITIFLMPYGKSGRLKDSLIQGNQITRDHPISLSVG